MRIDKKFISTILIVIMVIFTLSIFIGYGYKNRKSIDTLKNNSNTELINLSMDNVKSKTDIGDKVEINIYSKPKVKTSLNKVVYTIELKKDGKSLSMDDVNIIYNGRTLIENKGRYEIEREEIVNKDRVYTLSLIFNKTGNYDFKIYAENY